MLARSLVAVILSIPATTAIIGLFIALTPTQHWILPSLLMAFPVWIGLACASYQLSRARTAAGLLLSISILGTAAIALLKALGWTTTV
ncbi:MAG: hypothetical protein AAF542_07240 [Pseudomonadota bacterium]